MSTMSFAQMSPDNCLDAFAIQQKCHLFPWSQAVFTDSLSPPYFAYQMCENQQVIGYYLGLAVAGEATLMDIGIQHLSRGKGLANKLLGHFIEKCIELKCTEIWLEVRESNSAAISLYQKYHFEPIEIRKGYYENESGRENGLIMKRLV
ncbi:ribosomal protein S18-alanine N-acetyltransferase [Aliiglaciecola sp. LCG003]|uniref:ribosomal protein S18-alanine N-acetyltransferase n=1 Tax=Aliiglaciecola sp. LCG003 TaxID=3053655 RepID=UPI0025746FE2|nr:ribosomal protein S18-alanine N-acetyltransferase [Aliiglaciecola sp. LCG003]WJG08336.1 ribosomal protein S18-alanine N-acetyltransferase [Aliiglaciecola sp. LCG003]